MNGRVGRREETQSVKRRDKIGGKKRPLNDFVLHGV